MSLDFTKTQIAGAVAAACCAMLAGVASNDASAAKTAGQYVAGDFHNHTTCSDGSISMQKLVKKATDKTDTPWGLDWFVQAGHGGNGNRNCTLAEDATLATPAYPLVKNDQGTVLGPNTTWQNSVPPVTPKGDSSGTSPSKNMWRWQSLQEFQYPLIEYLARYKDKPLFLGMESVVAGHEHTSMSVITGQMPMIMDNMALPTTPGYTAVGNANALAMWAYCFDRATSDTSRGNVVTQPGNVNTGVGNNYDCSVPGSLNSSDPSWNAAAMKLVPTNPPGTPSNGWGGGIGVKGHEKTLQALKWMAAFHPDASYYVPAHLERAGPFNPNGNNGYNIEHLRNFNNTAPNVAFGFETQPGHGASSERGEYYPKRNSFATGPSTTKLVDSVGGTTYGGTGVYGAQIGGVWDALLGEGRSWWFFASSDWHNRGRFGPDDRRSTQDFYPGEYQRNYTMVRNGGDSKLRPQAIVDGLRTGNNWAASGQLIDRLAFVACIGNPGAHGRSDQAVESLTINAALNNTDLDFQGCATMGEKLVVPKGADVVISIVVRDPDGTNYSPYTFDNPSLAQIGIKQPLNRPVLDHVDLIRGSVTSMPKQPNDPNYAGAWPDTWLDTLLANNNVPQWDTVPVAAKNLTAKLYATFTKDQWTELRRDPQYKVMTLRMKGLQLSQYVRLRGTNLPPNVPYETDSDGNPLPDIHTNATTTDVAAGKVGTLKIPCTVVGTNLPSNDVTYTGNSINGCPNHLPKIGNTTYVAYDVAAWSDLWFYSNPIFIEVQGSTQIAGVK